MGSFQRTSGIGGLALFALGLGVPIAAPHADPFIGYGLIVLGLFLATIALTLFFSGRAAADNAQHIHLHFGDLVGEVVKAVIPEISLKSIPSVVVTPPGSTSAPSQVQSAVSASSVDHVVLGGGAQIFPPTVRAISPLYVGRIVISAAQLGDGSIEIAVLAFNGSSETITLASAHGAIVAGINNAVGSPLPTPTLRPSHVVAPIPPGTEFMIILDQPLPGPLAQTYSDALTAGDYVALDLRELRVMMRAEDDANLTAPLPLWHGVSMRRRDDIFTNRITMATFSAVEESDSAG
jgi:hypothetical protein